MKFILNCVLDITICCYILIDISLSNHWNNICVWYYDQIWILSLSLRNRYIMLLNIVFSLSNDPCEPQNGLHLLISRVCDITFRFNRQITKHTLSIWIAHKCYIRGFKESVYICQNIDLVFLPKEIIAFDINYLTSAASNIDHGWSGLWLTEAFCLKLRSDGNTILLWCDFKQTYQHN